MTRIVAVWNPASGSAPIESELRASLPGGTELVETTENDPGPGQARRAVDDGADIVVACGGDGTVRALLEPLAETETALGIIPLGTGNLLASNLGIEPGLGVDAGLEDGTAKTIDIGHVNGEAFAVMAGTGFDALMIRDADDRAKSKLGTAAYVWSGAKNLRTDLVGTKVWVDGRLWFEGPSSMVLVGNFGQISGGIDVFPAAKPNDGVLDIAVMGASTVREWVSVGWNLARGRQPRTTLAKRAQGKEIRVEHDRPRIYELDGEDRAATTDLVFSIQANALRVMQPKEQAR